MADPIVVPTVELLVKNLETGAHTVLTFHGTRAYWRHRQATIHVPLADGRSIPFRVLGLVE